MKKGPIRFWDYRWKLVSLTILIFAITYTKKPEAMISGLLMSLILTIFTGSSPGETIKSINAPLYLLLLMSPFIILTPGRELLFQLSFIKIYRESLNLLFTILIKSTSIILIFNALLYKAELTRLMQAMKAVGLPGKLISILISTYRYIFLYREDLAKLSTAAKLRAHSMKRGLTHLLTSADIMLTLLIRSYEQSERVQAAMVMRDYRGDFHFTEQFTSRVSDKIISLMVLMVSIGLILMENLC